MEEILGVLRRSWQSHFWTNFATLGVLTLSFSLILGTVLVLGNLSRLFTLWGDEIQVTIYLKDDITSEDRQNLENSLRTMAGVEKFSYMDKAQAASSFEKSLSSYGPQFLRSLKDEGENPFPASYSIRVAKAEKTPEKIESLAKGLLKVSGVEDVSYGQEWIKNYSNLLKVGRTTAAVFAFVLLLACLFTVSNSVRASLTARRDEIEILELVGATSSTIRKPFLIEGAFQGLVAAALSLLSLALIYNGLRQSLERILGSSAIVQAMEFLPWPTIVVAIFLGFFFGSLGSYLCVLRINTGWAANREKMA